MPDTNYVYTRQEAEGLRRAGQDIELFLRLATVRLEDHPDKAPFKAKEGLSVLSWLLALADRYERGEDITKD